MPVDFLICGTQKGGTTALDQYLRRHPQICMARAKEAHFFDNENLFQRGTPDYALYHALFALEPKHRVAGEATPIYMYWQDAPRRIWQYNPSMKLVVLLRNPIERAYSHWNMERSRNADILPFVEAIETEAHRCREALPLQHRVYSYADRGFYSEQIRRLWRYFTKEQVLILKSEDLRQTPVQTLERICTFLGVTPFAEVPHAEARVGSYTTPMPEPAKRYLICLFEQEIRTLENLLSWDCSDWLSL